MTGTDSDGITHNGNGYFIVVEIKPDLWVYSEDINFTDDNPDLGETITIDANIHAADNLDTVIDVPVSFYAHYPTGETVKTYKIGRTLTIEEMPPGTDWLVSTTWRNAAEGVYIIEVELGPGFSDDNNGNNQATREITVGNRAPDADAGPDQVVECACNTAEGTKVTLDGSGSYDADGDPLTFTWTGPFVGSPAHGAAPTVTLEAGCPNDYVITLVVNDGMANSEPDTMVITVVDTTPSSFTVIPEDKTVYRDGNGNEAELSDWLASDVEAIDDCGDVSISNDFTSFPYECGKTGSVTVTWTAEDDCGNTSTTSATFTIEDPTASVTYDGDLLISTGGEPITDVNLTAALWDNMNNLPDIDGEVVTFTLTAEGVGTIIKTASTIDGVASSILSLEPAIYMVNVTLGCSDFTDSAILVVYNPEGGFAIGAGHIVPGDDGLNTHPNARARFGFETRYKEENPDGYIMFRYFDGYMNLESEVIEQLVITGGRIVQFKGWATVNGVPGNWFFVKAIDNGEPGRNNDTFEIKVWFPGVSEEGDPSERAGGVLKAGNIVVQGR